MENDDLKDILIIELDENMNPSSSQRELFEKEIERIENLSEEELREECKQYSDFLAPLIEYDSEIKPKLNKEPIKFID